MPAAFAIGKEVVGDPIVAVFAAFGSFAMLLLVDFSGSMRRRLQAQVMLAVAGAVLVVVGSLVAGTVWLSVASMAIVGFAVLFSGVVSSVLAGATTSLLLAFILPVTLGDVSSPVEPLLGWGIAAAGSLLAMTLLWPAPAHDPFRDAIVGACRGLADRLRGTGADGADGAVEDLRRAFFATPFRPAGLGTADRAILRMVDELRWLDRVAEQIDPRAGVIAARAVEHASAAVLDRCAGLLDGTQRSRDDLHEAVATLGDALAALEAYVMRSGVPSTASALNPCFRAQEVSYVVAQIAANAETAVAAERRGWLDQLLGRAPTGIPDLLAVAGERAAAHLDRHSTWLHNSLRGAAALAGAVLVADVVKAEHAFWVVLGTLSVLRSNALSTGQSVVRAVLGTVAGIIVGAVIVLVVGTNTAVLWVLLPPAILVTGVAPAAISFAAGQAAFTVTALILFDLLAPGGLQTGLIRVEDVALGGAVSLVVGVLLWPRGAVEVLGTALAEAYVDVAAYLADVVHRAADGVRGADAPTAEALRAAGASRRLDDTFRGYLAERGSKPVPLEDVTRLVNGVAGIRLHADAVADLWRRDGVSDGDGAARQDLVRGAVDMTAWFSALAASLTGRGEVPRPPAEEDPVPDPAASVATVWTAEHLDAVRRLQGTLVESAHSVSRG
jgi:uncharacterized membrane protein YccC